MRVAVTGHRPDKLEGGFQGYPFSRQRVLINDWLRENLIDLCPTYGITGMALGVDQDFAEVCLELTIPFIAAIPFVGQDSVWPKDRQIYYQQLLAKAKEIVVVSEGGYASWKMKWRNAWMVNNCEMLLAVWDGSFGGTSSCVRFATGVGKPLRRFNPRDPQVAIAIP